MMRWNVIVTAFDEYVSIGEELCQRLTDAWPNSPTPQFLFVHGRQLEPGDLQAIDGAVVISDGAGEHRRMSGLLSMLEEGGVAMMALLDGPIGSTNPFEFAGALATSVDQPEAAITALLNGLLHRQREVVQLRNEVALAQRFQGGLRGEIDKIHEELQLAAMVQRDFLPREVPKVHGVDFGALWHPANYVSGDLYDVARLDEDHVGVFIADAVGHGVPAALMTMVISRSLVTKEIAGSDYRLLDPADVMGRLNAQMIRRQRGNVRFATAGYALVNCRTRRVVYAGAGHPPPIMIDGDGNSSTLETSGGLLGVFEDETYDQIELDMAIGDRILLYSDGFEQAFPARGDENRRRPSNRYLDEFYKLADAASSQQMIETIRCRLNDQAGSLHQLDDLTFLCILAGELAQPKQVDRVADRDAEPVADVA